jgi:hypothetical protein
MTSDIALRIEPARKTDTPVILRMIRALVDYERLTHEFSVTESILEKALFGAQPVAEVVLGYVGAEPVGFRGVLPRVLDGLGSDRSLSRGSVRRAAMARPWDRP